MGMSWTHEDAIAFEAAREVITDLMAIHTARIAEEGERPGGSAERIAELWAERSRLAAERAALSVADRETVERIRREYGAAVRAWRNSQNA